jgi:hypothetical protein
MSAEARREQREASRKLQEAANAIRDSRLRERILFSKGVMQGGSPEYSRSLEEQITSSVNDLQERIEEAASSVREPSEQRMGRALDRASDIARGLQSLEERVEESQGARSSQGARGAQGERTPSESPTEGSPNAPGSETPQSSSSGGQGARVGGGGLSAEQIRQFSREYRERRADAEALRRELAREGVDVGTLDRMIAQMRALEAARVYSDAEELERLQSSVVEGFKNFEFALRRAIEGEIGDRPLVGGTSDVPPEFRKLVDEYYKALARRDRPR